MARAAKSKSAKRDTPPKVMNFFQINGTTFSLGDLRKSDFSQIDDPKCSVKSIQTWAIQLNNILRGFAQQSEEG